MGEVITGQSYVIEDPNCGRNGVIVMVTGQRGPDGRYPVREPNGSCYLLAPEQLGIKEESPEKEVYSESMLGQQKKGKIIRKFK